MARKDREYNWLDDPFNEKKDKLDNGGPSKGLLGAGCLVAVILMIALAVVCLKGLADVASII